MKTLTGITFIVFAIAGLIQTIVAMKAVTDTDQIKWQLHSIKSLGFMILFYLMFQHG